MRTAVILPLSLLMAACGGGKDAPDPQNYIDYPPLWNDYVVGFGETINLAEGVAIEFVDVEEDSRCPDPAQCPVVGNARVVVRAITPRGAVLVKLNTDPALPSSALFDVYGVSLRTLSPNPPVDAQGRVQPIPDSAYEGTFFVIKAAPTPPST
ncbi:MAG: hypothetical protein ABI769_01765 [Pseudomonadota bacterium]